ncbi:aldo/keto reductase, partial [Falsihalocynthiibacter sp. S25ZX9]|uniref:aldo/keto reductase n=1 Tax=Falsihalocynthiibacter sp. S25ZX9 TaxID=3240870 RepID=UPI0035103466
MKRTNLGENGPEISQFGIVAMSFAGIYGGATMEESHAVLNTCRTAGVTHIDTANVYGKGRSEEIIGDWFANNPAARED